MTKAEQALLAQTIAELKAAFAREMTLALAPLVETINGLEQRSSNFAARVNASNKVYRAEITSLRDAVERLTPKAKAPVAPRLTDGQWNAAVKALKLVTPGVTFFAPSLVRAEAERQLAAPVQAKAVMAVADADEEVML